VNVVSTPSKVVEEAPSSVLTPELRRKWETAVLVAKSCDYLVQELSSFIR
jgi:acetyl/propionyl-CoA carboxylase alpha subunit